MVSGNFVQRKPASIEIRTEDMISTAPKPNQGYGWFLTESPGISRKPFSHTRPPAENLCLMLISTTFPKNADETRLITFSR